MEIQPLYKIRREIEACFKVDENTVVDGETGEVFDGEYLDRLQLSMREKADNIGAWIKQLKAEAEMCDAQAKDFEARKKACLRKADNLKEYLTFALDGENITTDRCKITFRTSTSVNVRNEELVPQEYKKQKITETVDKTTIGKLLKAGEAVPGAELLKKKNIQIK